jgi:hypothetical protein
MYQELYTKVLENTNPSTFVALFNNKLNNLQKCDVVQNSRIVHRVVQSLSQHNLIHSRHRHIKSVIKIMIHIQISLAIVRFA